MQSLPEITTVVPTPTPSPRMRRPTMIMEMCTAPAIMPAPTMKVMPEKMMGAYTQRRRCTHTFSSSLQRPNGDRSFLWGLTRQLNGGMLRSQHPSRGLRRAAGPHIQVRGPPFHTAAQQSTALQWELWGPPKGKSAERGPHLTTQGPCQLRGKGPYYSCKVEAGHCELQQLVVVSAVTHNARQQPFHSSDIGRAFL